MMRRYLPYFIASLTIHAGLFAVFLLWKIPPEPEPAERRVALEFAGPVRAGPPRTAAPSPAAAAAQRGLPIPEAGTLAPLRQPRAAQPLPALPSADQRAVLAAEDKPAVSEPAAVLAFPSYEEIRSRLPSGSEQPAQPAPEQASAGYGYVPQSALEWEGRQRVLLSEPRLKYPDILLEKGLETEVEALFSVAPGGQVTEVQITRSSGFATVDRAVEQALFDALFTPSAEKEEDRGRIQFRFRLERKR